jgi:hypothetical protein
VGAQPLELLLQPPAGGKPVVAVASHRPLRCRLRLDEQSLACHVAHPGNRNRLLSRVATVAEAMRLNKVAGAIEAG